MKQIKVMLVDDSAVVRQVLQAILEQEPDIKVIATASDPLFALEKLKKEWPDVIVLDVEMPRMDGITFLTKIMAEHPTPVVICSSLTEKGAETTLQAMAAGAVDIITKPTVGLKNFLQESAQALAMAVRAAAQANVKRLGKAQCRRHHARSQPACHGPDHGADRGNRHLYRRHPGTGSRADDAASRLSRHRHSATHAGEIYRLLRRATQQPVPDRSAGSKEQ
jgi:chemotaxis response regulator CheB